MRNLEPKANHDLDILADIFWDLNISASGKELYEFVLGERDIAGLCRDEVKARMLMTVGWYRLIDIFGLKRLMVLLTDEALNCVWVDDLRNQYAFARRILEGTLPKTV